MRIWFLVTTVAAVCYAASDGIAALEAAQPLPEHPRPDFRRPDWINLNGVWGFSFDTEDRGRKSNWQNDGCVRFPLRITVPFGWGTPLSGVENGGNIGWYRREFEVPPEWKGKRVFLVVGASDRHTDCWIDGHHLGDHEGGYTPFEFELTDQIVWGRSQQITLRIDDTWYGWVLSGKQYNYGEVRGIWQTVYLEARGRDYLKSVRYYPNAAKGEVEAVLTLDTPALEKTEARLGFAEADMKSPVVVKFEKGTAVARTTVKLPQPHLWTLDDPYLYEVEVSVGNDHVSTYFGLRDISVAKVPGLDIPYVALNGKPLYLRQALDQSFTPDGFYTFPSDAYARNEILIAKKLGLNGLRTHVKLEVPRKLYWADRLGVLIQADIPNCWGDPSDEFFAAHRYALARAIERDFNHPSIYQWTLFNETWGLMTHGEKDKDGKAPQTYLPETQARVRALYDFAKQSDPTRLVEDMSPTFNDHVVTDVNSWHTYAPGYWWEHVLNAVCGKTRPGSDWNYIGGNRQGEEPMMNSECGNVWGYKGYLGDMDWSWDYHLMMDAFRRHMSCAGFVYTEHHDVRNEWNGYVRADRTWKDTGIGDLYPGMELKDLHADAYIALDREMCRENRSGDVREIDVELSLATDRYADRKLVLAHFLRYYDDCGRLCENLSNPITDVEWMARAWQTGQVARVAVRLPSCTAAGIIGFLVRDCEQIIARNFTCFVTRGTPPVNRVERDASQTAGASWDVKHWTVMDGKKVCGAGTGFFEYRFAVPKSVSKAVFRAEVSTKRLYAKDLDGATTNNFTDLEIIMGAGTTDRAKNPNSYPMTSSDKWPGRVEVFADGTSIGFVDLPDDPADHRGILSWFAQKRDGYLHDAGSYGYLCERQIPDDILKRTAGGDLTIRLKAMGRGLAVFGSDFGRYPFGPTLDFECGEVMK